MRPAAAQDDPTQGDGQGRSHDGPLRSHTLYYGRGFVVSPLLAGDEGPRVVVRVERLQVLERLADADELHRQA